MCEVWRQSKHRLCESESCPGCVRHGADGPADETLTWIVAALKASQKDELAFHRQAVDDLNRELGKLRSRVSQAYKDKLDGKINEQMWSNFHTKYTTQQETLERQINAHLAADRTSLQQGIQILAFANHEERAKLLQFLLLNSTWKRTESCVLPIANRSTCSPTGCVINEGVPKGI